MSSSGITPSPEPPGPRPLLRRLDQVSIAVVLGLSWLAIVLGLYLRGYHRGELIEIDQTPTSTFTRTKVSFFIFLPRNPRFLM